MMRHDATECTLGIAQNIHLALFIHIDNPVVSLFVVVRDTPVVGAIGNERALGPAIKAIRTTRQETQRYPVAVFGKGMGEAAVGILFALLSAGLVGVCEEDTVMGG